MGWWKRAKTLLDAVAVAEILGAAWRFIRAWANGEASVTSGLSFTPGFAMQLYAALVAGGIVLLCGWNWPWINARRPSESFRKIAPNIREAMERNLWDLTLSHEQDLETPIATSQTKEIIIRISQLLDDLRIDHPPPIGNHANLLWRQFLPYILAYAEAGKIRAARRLWRELKERDEVRGYLSV